MYLLVAGVSKLPAQIHFLRNNSLYCFIYFNLFSFFLKCGDCLKWRVCYASRVLTKNEILELEVNWTIFRSHADLAFKISKTMRVEFFIMFMWMTSLHVLLLWRLHTMSPFQILCAITVVANMIWRQLLKLTQYVLNVKIKETLPRTKSSVLLPKKINRFENCCLYLIFENSYFMNCLYYIYSYSRCKVHCSVRNYWENI